MGFSTWLALSCKPKRPQCCKGALVCGVVAASPAAGTTPTSCYRATVGVGVPDQRGCLACGQRCWPWKHLLCWSLGAHGGLGAASQQGADGLHFLVYCQCVGSRPRSRRRYQQRLALELLSMTVLTSRGLNPGRCRGAQRNLCCDGIIVCQS